MFRGLFFDSKQGIMRMLALGHLTSLLQLLPLVLVPRAQHAVATVAPSLRPNFILLMSDVRPFIHHHDHLTFVIRLWPVINIMTLS